MSAFGASRKQRILVGCAPITERAGTPRAMRMAIQRVRRTSKRAAEFAHQQAFDRAIAALVQAIPVSDEISEWFANENLIPARPSRWRRILLNPAVLAIALASLVIAAVFTYRVREKIHDFPGAGTARKLLTVAASTRSVVLDPVQTDAGALSDLFFMKHRLEHYDVPDEFSDFRALGVRVFDDEEVHRVAQIWLVEKRMQLFLFPAERDDKGNIAPDHDDWRFVEQEGWTGAVKQRNGICCMAALRGTEQVLARYLNRTATSATPSPHVDTHGRRASISAPHARVAQW